MTRQLATGCALAAVLLTSSACTSTSPAPATTSSSPSAISGQSLAATTGASVITLGQRTDEPATPSAPALSLPSGTASVAASTPDTSEPTALQLPGAPATALGYSSISAQSTPKATATRSPVTPSADPVHAAAAFVTTYATRYSTDSAADNFATRSNSLATAQVVQQLSAQLNTSPPPIAGATVAVIDSAAALTYPRPTPLLVSVGVLYHTVTSALGHQVGVSSTTSTIIGLTRSSSGWIVSSMRPGAG